MTEISTEKIPLFDPSEWRPEHKEQELFRNYEEGALIDRVKKTYYEMHTNQTVDFVNEKMEKWGRFNHAELTIMEALDKLNALVDESDPDVDLPNSVHAFQTAERAREAHPEKDWFHLVGLIHDLGKVMALYGEPQWCVVGDTFPVGCAFSNNIVFGKESFMDNPDTNNSAYSSELGIYTKNCGLDNVKISWGHDEYLYQVLKNHPGCKIPEEGMYMIRYHSLYPWHTAGDYQHLANNKDGSMLNWILEFNKFDLYSKSEVIPDINSLVPYYQSLIDKYVPGVIRW
ncbi:unnamed protein product [Owenia fusiformis]|uniref:Inositol oxygenase n=1 Tax=Owenia fusiformis TaxID=6347 RepID=A0A8S4Q9M1_OWEFU|nr:unnamed protein product [Owenia fusiformis]